MIIYAMHNYHQCVANYDHCQTLMTTWAHYGLSGYSKDKSLENNCNYLQGIATNCFSEHIIEEKDEDYDVIIIMRLDDQVVVVKSTDCRYSYWIMSTQGLFTDIQFVCVKIEKWNKKSEMLLFIDTQIVWV